MDSLETRPDRSRGALPSATPSPRALRAALEKARAQALRNGRLEHDPLRLVLDYPDPEDQEVAGLIAALLAYGRVDLLRAHTRSLLALLGLRPARRLRRGVPPLPSLRYRFHTETDLAALLAGIRSVLLRHGSLGAAFASRLAAGGGLREALGGFACELREAAVPPAGGRTGAGLRFLLPDPRKGGACKRWLLYLRWMIRRAPEDPDPGVWADRVPASILVVPLDTHLIRVGRRLGLTSRASPDWRMAEEITAALRRCELQDPVRYDFPLCHLGMAGTCPPRLAPGGCRRCPLVRVCPTGRDNAGIAGPRPRPCTPRRSPRAP